jgi:hypothetical protein
MHESKQTLAEQHAVAVQPEQQAPGAECRQQSKVAAWQHETWRLRSPRTQLVVAQTGEAHDC